MTEQTAQHLGRALGAIEIKLMRRWFWLCQRGFDGIAENIGVEAVFRQGDGEAKGLQPRGPYTLFRFAAGGEGDKDRTALCLQNIADRVVACLRNRKLAPLSKDGKSWRKRTSVTLSGACADKAAKSRLRQIWTGDQAPRSAKGRSLGRLQSRADQIEPDGAATGRNNDIKDFGEVRPGPDPQQGRYR